MLRKPPRTVFLSIVMICAVSMISLSCAKSEDASPASEARHEESGLFSGKQSPKSKRLADVKVEEKADEGKPDDEKDVDTDDGLMTNFYKPMDFARERLLEYTVTLTYETPDLHASRQELLAITAKYGFIKSGSASLESDKAYMNSQIFVKSHKLYDALQDLSKVGKLVSDRISAVDHTEDMVLNERKAKREEKRIARRIRSTGQVTARAKTWRDVENALESSEDSLDAAEHAKWKIRDKVTWAGIQIYLKGPETPDRVKVPKYRNAFVGLVNLFLNLVYAFIWLIPLIAVIGVIIWQRQRIASIFSRKKNG